VATLVIRALDEHGFPGDAARPVARVTAHVSLNGGPAAGNQKLRELATKLAKETGARSVTPRHYQTVLLSFAGKHEGGHKRHRPEGTKATKLQRLCGKLDFSRTRTASTRCWLAAARRRMEGLAGDYVRLPVRRGD